MLYALVSRQHLIRIQYMTGLRSLLPTRKRKAAKKLYVKLRERTKLLIADAYPGSIDYTIEQMGKWDTYDGLRYPRYVLKVNYPIGKPGEFPKGSPFSDNDV